VHRQGLGGQRSKHERDGHGSEGALIDSLTSNGDARRNGTFIVEGGNVVMTTGAVAITPSGLGFDLARSAPSALCAVVDRDVRFHGGKWR
jgi:hypothetical protein